MEKIVQRLRRLVALQSVSYSVESIRMRLVLLSKPVVELHTSQNLALCRVVEPGIDQEI